MKESENQAWSGGPGQRTEVSFEFQQTSTEQAGHNLGNSQQHFSQSKLEMSIKHATRDITHPQLYTKSIVQERDSDQRHKAPSH